MGAKPRRARGARRARVRVTGATSASRRPPDGRARLRNLVVREGRHTGKLQVRIVTHRRRARGGRARGGAQRGAGREPLGRAVDALAQPGRDDGRRRDGAGVGRGELPERLGELDLRISAEAFFQTNTEMAELLYGVVSEYAALEGWERVYDLYSGIGTIALTLAPRAGELWGIELIEPAVADAIAGAQRNGDHATLTSSPATPARRCPSCSSAPGAPTCSSSTRRARGCRRRSCTASSTPRPSASSTSRATPRRSRPTPPNWSRPAGCCARSARGHVSADAPHRVRRAVRAG